MLALKEMKFGKTFQTKSLIEDLYQNKKVNLRRPSRIESNKVVCFASMEVKEAKKGKKFRQIDGVSSKKSTTTRCESVAGDYDLDFPAFEPENIEIKEEFNFDFIESF